MSDNFILQTGKNDVLRITVYGINNLQNSPCIIYVHGFKGFKDWGFVPYLGDYFSKNEFSVISFNFSHCGVGENLLEFDEPDKFAKNTFSLEVSELNQIIDAYIKGFFGKISGKGVGLLGHSRGGAVALITGSKRKEINAVTTWSSIAKIDRYTERQKQEWMKNGFVEVINSRTNQVMRLDISLLEDIENNKNTILNMETAVSNLNKPLLITHGEQDLTVPIEEAKMIYNWSNKDLTETYFIPAIGHTYDIKHPFDGSNPKFEYLLEKTKTFFKSNLN
ncbi:MAG: acyl-CoA thioester hydrolase/BAAT C-terminal domain-containing protein [Ignavibacteriaceae bacterium]